MGQNRAERIADKIVVLLSDFRTDIRQAGTYFARIAPTKVYEQFDEFVQGAETEKAEKDIREGLEKNVHKLFTK
jgi:hypothetical protein